MAILKCKICGGALEIDSAQSVTTCQYCGTKQTLPRITDERRANLYDRANHFRHNNDFDKASLLCKKAESDWVKNEKKLTYFVNHSEICIIGESISSIQAFAKYKEKAELFSELNKTKVIITHLSAMENVKKKRFSWQGQV